VGADFEAVVGDWTWGELCLGPEEFKAWSQNLGHDNVLTTFTSYGKILERIAEHLPMSAVEPAPRQ